MAAWGETKEEYLAHKREQREKERLARLERGKDWLDRILDAMRQSAGEHPEFMKRMDDDGR